MQEPTLKPCPFCGGADVTVFDKSDYYGSWFVAFCKECGASGPGSEDQEDAAELWNSRHGEGE